MKISKTFFRRIVVFSQLMLIALVSVAKIKAQTRSIDLSFNAVLSKDGSGGNFVVQPDGKIISSAETFQPSAAFRVRDWRGSSLTELWIRVSFRQERTI